MAALRAVCDLGFAGRQGAAHSAFPAADSSSLAAADLELLGSWSVRLAAWARSDPVNFSMLNDPPTRHNAPQIIVYLRPINQESASIKDFYALTGNRRKQIIGDHKQTDRFLGT